MAGPARVRKTPLENYKFLCLLLLGACLASAEGLTAENTVLDTRLWSAPDHTRLVFDLSAPVKYRVFSLSNPKRVVVDMHDTSMRTPFKPLSVSDAVVASIRSGQPRPGMFRVVLDVKEAVQPRTFLLKAMHGRPFRLVVDLMRKGRDERITAGQLRQHKGVVIAVDAGHGGEDPGAIGRHGLQEKTVTLAIARALARAINARQGMRAVLIRKGDYFIPLRKRVAMARKAKAIAMISIHADAIRNRKVAGASVYTLSGKASDKVAAMLAKKENAADAIGGAMPGEVTDPVVNRILVDLITTDSLNSAQLLAEQVLSKLARVGPVKYARPKSARFAVLKAAEIPSILVEVDYISNPRRERLLRSYRHQRRLAMALLDASTAFLQQQGLLETPAPRMHVVRQGESLWSISKHYGISLNLLRTANGMKHAQKLHIGQRLHLPSS